jgi:hypothetical protein
MEMEAVGMPGLAMKLWPGKKSGGTITWPCERIYELIENR